MNYGLRRLYEKLLALGYLSRFSPETAFFFFFANNSKTRCERQKQIPDSERASKNTWIEKVHFFLIYIFVQECPYFWSANID